MLDYLEQLVDKEDVDDNVRPNWRVREAMPHEGGGRCSLLTERNAATGR
jgi:hypothetical protein